MERIDIDPEQDELFELRRQNRLYLSLLNNSRDMLYRMSLPDGKYEYVSPSSYDIMGYSPEDLYRSPLLIKKIIHPDWLAYFISEWEHLKDGIAPPTYEYQILNKKGEARWIHQLNNIITDENGHAIAIEGIVTDITNKKRADAAIDRRILALASPLADTTGLDFTDLFDIDGIQRLQDEFSIATGVASLITLPDGTPITKPSNFCRMCSETVRQTEKGRERCRISDAKLGEFNSDGPIVQKCLSAGLWGAGAAITIEGRHIANWLIGQIRDKTQTDDQIRTYAREIGADETAFLESFHEIPTMSRERFQKIAQTLYTIANQLSNIAYQNLRQSRMIAELQKKEVALRESRARLQESQRMAHLGNWYWDVATGKVEWSEEVYRIFHLDPETFTPQIDSIMALSPWPGERERHTELIQEAIRSHQPGAYEQRFLLPDGSSGYYFSTYQGIYDDSGSLLAIKGTVQDITERKKTHDALSENELRIRTLFQAIPDLIWLKDTNGVFLGCNHRFEQFFGASEQEIIGKTDYDFVPSDIADSFRCHDNIVLETGKPVRNEETITFASDGHTEILETLKTPMYRNDGELAGVLGIGRDITERKMAEEQLQIRERMDSIGTLAGGIAHDFNNLLVGIMGNLDLLRMDNSGLTPDQNLSLDESYELSQKAARLIKSLLSLTSSTVSEVRSIDLHEVAKDVFTMLSRTTDRLIEKKLDIEPGVCTVMGQYDQLHQVLLNMGTNAIQAIEEKGVTPGDFIRISGAACSPEDEARRGFDSGTCIHIIFEDSGAGMTEEVRRRAFEPLFSTKSRGVQKGQGLGLAMVYNIITRNHHGMIEIESALGAGTRFHLYLKKASVQHTPADNMVQDIHRGTETILIIDDEVSVINVAGKALKKYDYTVLTASDGIEGIDLFATRHNEIDLVILDLTLPRMSGTAVFEKIRDIDPAAKIVVSSGQSIDETMKTIDANGFVPKPYKLTTLLHTVREVIDAS